MNKSEQLEKLRWRMFWVNCLLHFSRNNPRSTVCFYNRFISIIGYDEFEDYNTHIVNAWKSAEYSFDKMYGLIKAWNINKIFEVNEEENNNNP